MMSASRPPEFTPENSPASDFSFLDDDKGDKESIQSESTPLKPGSPLPLPDKDLEKDDNISLYSTVDDADTAKFYEPPELNFQKRPISVLEKDKRERILKALDDPDTNLERWRYLAIHEHGLIDDDLRRKVWPKLLEIDTNETETPPTLQELSGHVEYYQVVLDVNRSLNRFPPGIPYEQRVALQDELTVLILRVIMKYPELRYYQGYHDVAVTFLLVVGEAIAFKIMERLSTEHLRECMEPTMEKTLYRLHFVYSIIKQENLRLYEFLERSDPTTMYALPWYLTWFSHSLNHYKDVVRLFDYFLASPPLAPLYVTAALTMYRTEDVLKADCDMFSVHSVLTSLPDDLPFEDILKNASRLYIEHPPEDIEHDVQLRIQAEEEARKRDEERAAKRRRMVRAPPHRAVWGQMAQTMQRFMFIWMPRNRGGLHFRYLVATATVAVGVFAYFQSSDSYFGR